MFAKSLTGSDEGSVVVPELLDFSDLSRNTSVISQQRKKAYYIKIILCTVPYALDPEPL